MQKEPWTIPSPDPRLIREIDDVYEDIARRRGGEGCDHSARMSRAAEAALRDILPDIDDVSVRHIDRGPLLPGGSVDHRLVLSMGGGEVQRVRMTRSSAARCLAQLAVTALQRNALLSYVRVRRDEGCAGDGRGWGDARLLHPAAFLIEEATGREYPQGQDRVATSRALPAAMGGKGPEPTPRKLTLSPGTPQMSWADRRPSVLSMEWAMPSTLVAALAGRRLAEVVQADMPHHRAEAYAMVRIEGAVLAGSPRNPRVDLTLASIRPVPRGAPPEGASSAIMDAWSRLRDSAWPI